MTQTTPTTIYDKAQEAAASIKSATQVQPETAIILGSGLGALTEKVNNPTVIPYKDIPHFPISTVSGHAGELHIGELNGRQVLLMKGRAHVYEGYPLNQITLPVRAFHALGVKNLIVTNSAGGIHPRLNPGDLMLLNDHLNLIGGNPLIGAHDERLGVRFPPMANAYDKDLRRKAHRIAVEQDVVLKEGVYCALSGPSYETPAEIRYLSVIGADAVGMSTVPEVIVARHCNLNVLGISCITNVLHEGPSQDTHADVLKAASEAGPNFVRLVTHLVSAL